MGPNDGRSLMKLSVFLEVEVLLSDVRNAHPPRGPLMERLRLINKGDLSAGHQVCLELSVVDLTYVYVGVARKGTKDNRACCTTVWSKMTSRARDKWKATAASR